MKLFSLVRLGSCLLLEGMVSRAGTLSAQWSLCNQNANECSLIPLFSAWWVCSLSCLVSLNLESLCLFQGINLHLLLGWARGIH